ncbi:MAG: N-acetyltransferase [Bryobacteraceae bacterium]|jgi:ribosomal protein S18 acetylase RimI-like enzyme
MTFFLRRFRPSDIGELLAIERACFGQDAYDRNLFAEYLRVCGGLFLVVEGGAPASSGHAGKPILLGYSIACVSRARPGLANLISIAVAPEARGGGAASLLLSSTIRRLKLRGVERLTLVVRESNGRAIRLYERHGFTRLRRSLRYYEDGEDGLLMRRRL